jgi:hypothetical protein
MVVADGLWLKKMILFFLFLLDEVAGARFLGHHDGGLGFCRQTLVEKAGFLPEETVIFL